MESNNSKRIAINTLLLYLRMIIVTVVSLFTVRITLSILGVEDYGIYNVVGGVVGLFGILNGSLTSATQRFLTFELGGGNIIRFNQVFNMFFQIFIILCFIILILGGVLGTSVVSEILVIPIERLNVAKKILYLSLFTFTFNFLTIPYISSVIAYEKMGIFAFISLLAALAKLILVYGLYVSNYDKLLTYGLLLMFVSFLTLMAYSIICNKKLNGCHFKFYWNSTLFKELMGYTGWNLFGSMTSIFTLQGQAIILNIFFGPTVNAAKAIADKINGVVVSFSNDFYMAVRPQIIKSYASGEKDRMFKLVYQSTRFSFYLLLLLTLPIIFLMPKVLNIWLGEKIVTEDMIIFSQLILVYSLVIVFEQPITVMIQATGKIRNYQIIIAVFTVLFLPICYLIFKAGAPAYYSLIVLIFIYAIAQVIRIFVAKRQLGLSIRAYIHQILVPILYTLIPAIGLTYFLSRYVPDDLLGIIGMGLLNIVLIAILIFLFGINTKEREMVVTVIKKKIFKN